MSSCLVMPTSNANIVLIHPTDHSLQELTRFSHDKSQAVEINQHLEELRALERFDGVGEFATFPQRGREIATRLSAAGSSTIGRFGHVDSLFSQRLERGNWVWT